MQNGKVGYEHVYGLWEMGGPLKVYGTKLHLTYKPNLSESHFLRPCRDTFMLTHRNDSESFLLKQNFDFRTSSRSHSIAQTTLSESLGHCQLRHTCCVG